VICCVDVDYGTTSVTTACVGFDAWTDAAARLELVVRSEAPAADYRPGAFYQRELPFLEAVLARLPEAGVVIVDGYVWLGPERAGLGWHLHARRGGVVVGVAKTAFPGAEAIPVLRGGSRRPLFVTAIGELAPDAAAAQVAVMHGEHRIPTLLGRADRLARGR
jgi:deoxyribonuclease V